MEKNISDKVKNWLATQFDTDSNRVDEMLDSQLATTYLLIWPIMEQKLFGGFMQKEKIEEAADTYSNYYSKMNVQDIVKHFHERYQDRTRYANLKHGDNAPVIDAILNKRFVALDYKEKLMLMFYVVYRYRNNIFHGSKGIQSWTTYSTQIDKCIEFMMIIVDCYNAYIKPGNNNENDLSKNN